MHDTVTPTQAQICEISMPQIQDDAKSYEDGSTIDWLHEEFTQRERDHFLRSQRGAAGLLGPLMNACTMWFVVVFTGVGIGLAGVSFSVQAHTIQFSLRIDRHG